MASSDMVSTMNSIAYTTRTLRIVNNNTPGYYGGFSVELSDGSVVAGPYATKDAAKQAKVDLIAGRCVESAG